MGRDLLNLREWSRKNYAKNAEKLREKARFYYWKHREKKRARTRELYFLNHEKKLAQVAIYRKNNRGKIRAYEKNVTEKSDKWKIRHRAKSLVAKKIRDGILIKQPCIICKTDENIHAHHENYSNSLLITWLCKDHHYELHNEKRMRY